MIRIKNRIQKIVLGLICFGCIMMFCGLQTFATEGQLVTSVEALTEAMMNAQDGDTILVGDITFQPMPMGMMQVPKNLTIKSGKEGNAVFTNATFALNGTISDSAPLTVRFEGIDFVGDNAGNGIDVQNPPNISSKSPGIMKTMCAGIFKMNLDVTYSNCTFAGYHYGYGGVFCGIYSSEDNINELRLTLENCVFRANAGNYGGVLYLIGYNHNVNLVAGDCVFEGNAAATGGAIWAENANVSLSGCRFVDNGHINNDVTNPVGGALALYDCAAELENCVIKGNTSVRGGGIFCRIAPFHTMILRSCTLNGNKADQDSSICAVPAETNYGVEPKAYLYFTSIANHAGAENLHENPNLSMFGCFLADENSLSMEPDQENGYCLSMTCEMAKQKGYTEDSRGRIMLSGKAAILPVEAVETVANGRYAEYAGRLAPGDFVPEELGSGSSLTQGNGGAGNVATQGDSGAGNVATQGGTDNTAGRGENEFEGSNQETGAEQPDSITDLESQDVSLDVEQEELDSSRDHGQEGTEELDSSLESVQEGTEEMATIAADVLGDEQSIEKVSGTEPMPVTNQKAGEKKAGSPIVWMVLVGVVLALAAVSVYVLIGRRKGAVRAESPKEALPGGSWIEKACGREDIKDLLSTRELEVLPLLLAGQSREQIAKALFISESTVKKHASSIYSKMRVSGKAELISKMAEEMKN